MKRLPNGAAGIRTPVPTAHKDSRGSRTSRVAGKAAAADSVLLVQKVKREELFCTKWRPSKESLLALVPHFGKLDPLPKLPLSVEATCETSRKSPWKECQ